MTIAFTFPGQGSQQTGMGQELAGAYSCAREVFDEVNDALDQDLSGLMWSGTIEDLTLTENAQPALMAVSMAVVRVLESQFSITLARTANFVAGHSLGEYSALAAAGTFSLADTARLLRIRGRAMQQAAPPGTGAMAAILGLDFDHVTQIARKAAGDGVCQAANDNAPGQVVVSGSKDAVDAAIVLAKQAGARRALALPVSAPFHCALMQPAAKAMAEALAAVQMKEPAVPLMANVTAARETGTAAIRRQLVEQVTGAVRWRESVLAMAAEGVETFCELGTGRVLSGLARRIAPEARPLAMSSPQDIEKAAGILAGSNQNA